MKYTTYESIQNELEEEEEAILSENSIESNFESVISFYKNFRFLNNTSCMCCINEKKDSTKDLSKPLETAIRNGSIIIRARNELRTFNIAKKTPIMDIYREIHMINKYINALNSYSTLWLNPAFLAHGNGRNPRAIPMVYRKTYIIYKSEKRNAIFRREIEYTQENLDAFKNAVNSNDIERIPMKSEVEMVIHEPGYNFMDDLNI